MGYKNVLERAVIASHTIVAFVDESLCVPYVIKCTALCSADSGELRSVTFVFLAFRRHVWNGTIYLNHDLV